MIQCGACNVWVHLQCEKLEGGEWANTSYKCPACRCATRARDTKLARTGAGRPRTGRVRASTTTANDVSAAAVACLCSGCKPSEGLELPKRCSGKCFSCGDAYQMPRPVARGKGKSKAHRPAEGSGSSNLGNSAAPCLKPCLKHYSLEPKSVAEPLGEKTLCESCIVRDTDRTRA